MATLLLAFLIFEATALAVAIIGVVIEVRS
jgi:hypothetical protein